MDFTSVGGVLVVLLAAIPAVGAYFQRETRRTRKANRQLQAVVIEYKLHCFQLESDLADRGVRPRPRPELIRAVESDDDAEQGAGAPTGGVDEGQPGGDS